MHLLNSLPEYPHMMQSVVLFAHTELSTSLSACEVMALIALEAKKICSAGETNQDNSRLLSSFFYDYLCF